MFAIVLRDADLVCLEQELSKDASVGLLRSVVDGNQKFGEWSSLRQSIESEVPTFTGDSQLNGGGVIYWRYANITQKMFANIKAHCMDSETKT